MPSSARQSEIAAADAGRESRRQRLPRPNCDRADLQRRGHLNDPVAVLKADGSVETRVTKLFMFDGLKRVEIDEAAAGDIVCLAGIENITIGETITSPDHRVPIARIAVDEPTVSMIFGVNTSPMAGRKVITSPHETCATGSLASFWATCRCV